MLTLSSGGVQVDSTVKWVVDKALGRPPSGVVPLWVQGHSYHAGKPVHTLVHRGPLPLPTLASAAAQRIPLDCTSSGSTGSVAPHLCGGSEEDPSTGAPYFPRPIFEDPAGVLNVLTAGAFGDGRHDETKALQAAILRSRTVFIPW